MKHPLEKKTPNKTRSGMNKMAFDPTINKWVVFFTTDRVDYDYESGQALNPVMCDYHVIGEYTNKEEAQKHI